MFNNTVQDLLMVVYLANLTRSQVVLQEKLNDFLVSFPTLQQAAVVAAASASSASS
jgi:hypothetical protein